MSNERKSPKKSKDIERFPILDIQSRDVNKKEMKKAKEMLCDLDDSVEEAKNINIAQYNVSLWTNESMDCRGENMCKAKDLKNVVHSTIIFYSDDGKQYNFEWGALNNSMDDELNSNGCWTYKGESWFGCSPLEGDMEVNIPLTLFDIVIYSIRWDKLNLESGKKAYPYNCRGFVDSILNGLLKEKMISWK